jgi:hypothetical protein
LSEEVKEIAWKAQHRLHGWFSRLKLRGKPHQKVVTAVARELGDRRRRPARAGYRHREAARRIETRRGDTQP